MEASEVIKELKRRVGKTSQKEVAISFGMTPQFICDVLKGRRDMTENLARELGYIRVINYVQVTRQ